MENIGIAILNIFLVLAVSPFVDGIQRKVRARIHSRKGPPLLQPYYDLAKLMVKEDQTAANNTLFNIAPVVCLGSVVAMALYIPMAGIVPLGFAGDVIVLVYLLSIGPICLCIGGMASGSPYAYVGANREMMLLMVVEPVLAIELIASALKTNTLVLHDIIAAYAQQTPSLSMIICTIAFFLTLHPELGRVPFDQAEAEQEIMEGPLVEYSGRKFALMKWAFSAKQIVLVVLFVEWFIPWPIFGSTSANIISTLVKSLILAILIEVIAQVFPRLKVNQALRFFVIVIAFAVAGLLLAVVGL